MAKGRKAGEVWVSTTRACELLNVSRYTLATARVEGQLRKGHHWKVKNPNSARLTYLWHVERMEMWQASVQTSAG